jgi:threonine dehydrogenase-like Zn-dependent dehydrogenase
MSVHPLITPAADPVREAKVHLAAAHRLAVLHELEGKMEAAAERQDFEEAVSLLADGVMPAESLITDVVPLSEPEGAFERLACGEEIVKLLIDSR